MGHRSTQTRPPRVAKHCGQVNTDTFLFSHTETPQLNTLHCHCREFHGVNRAIREKPKRNVKVKDTLGKSFNLWFWAEI